MLSSCEQDNGPSVFRKGRKFFNQLPDFKGQFSMQSAVACSYELQRKEFYDEES